MLQCYYSNHIVLYKCIKPTWYIPQMYMMLYIYYVSIKNKTFTKTLNSLGHKMFSN